MKNSGILITLNARCMLCLAFLFLIQIDNMLFKTIGPQDLEEKLHSLMHGDEEGKDSKFKHKKEPLAPPEEANTAPVGPDQEEVLHAGHHISHEHNHEEAKLEDHPLRFEPGKEPSIEDPNEVIQGHSKSIAESIADAEAAEIREIEGRREAKRQRIQMLKVNQEQLEHDSLFKKVLKSAANFVGLVDETATPVDQEAEPHDMLDDLAQIGSIGGVHNHGHHEKESKVVIEKRKKRQRKHALKVHTEH